MKTASVQHSPRPSLRWGYLQLNMEIQRRSVALAVRRVDQNLEVLNQPPPPAAPGRTRRTARPHGRPESCARHSTTFASQNNFMSVWLNFIETKMQIMAKWVR